MNIQLAVAAACMILCLFPDRVLARQEQSRVDCGTPDNCVRSLYEYVKANEPISGLPSPVERIIHKLADYGDAVVPSLVDLLADPDVEVANMAGAALREIESIEPRHLPQIIEGLDRGVHWLPAALGRIDSPEAAKEAVYRYLVSRSKPYNQEAYAVKLSGERAIPYVLEVARCREQCEAEDHQSLALLIRDFSEEKAMYTDGLSAIATDESTPEETARGVLHMIAALGPHGAAAEADLLELRATRPELSDAVDRALVGIAAKTSTEVLTRWLSEASGAFKKTSILKKIAALGPVAADAGPAVLAAMEDHNPAVRNAAGRALGYIQYCDSADEMIALLQAEEMDVRLTWVLTESLGRMRVREARPALTRLAEHHWYPRVRSAAATALEKIDTGENYDSRYPQRYFGREFFDYEVLWLDSNRRCYIEPPKAPPQSSPDILGQPIVQSQLADLRYAPEGSHSASENKQEGPNLPGKNPEKRGEIVLRTPEVGIRVEGGWLVGSDRGEWGGELAFIKEDGSSEIVRHGNVNAIHKLGERYIAVMGLSHLGISWGKILDLSRQNDGSWQAKTWKILPAAPESSHRISEDEVLVIVEASGGILLREDGEMKMADCTDAEN